MEAEPSPKLLDQRIRNRIIECLEEVAQVRSAKDIPSPYDMINDLDGWLYEPVDQRTFPEPAYTPKEVDALRDVYSSFNALCTALPKFFETEQMMSKQEWLEFQLASITALAELSKRGRLSEELEVDK